MRVWVRIPLVYLIQMFNVSYPEGDVGGNQLLDGSGSRLPVYPYMTQESDETHKTAVFRPEGNPYSMRDTARPSWARMVCATKQGKRASPAQ